MLLSDRQRLVAETGLLTLLGWMAVTIAFSKSPRDSNAGQTRAVMPAPHIERTARDGASLVPMNSSASRPPEIALLDELIEEPAVKLPAAQSTMTSGTVIRMGEGLYTRPEPRVPADHLHRGHGGSRHIGPVP